MSPARTLPARREAGSERKMICARGASFVVSHRPVLTSMIHLTLIASLAMTLAHAGARHFGGCLFHLAPEDAIIVFALGRLRHVAGGPGLALGNRVPKQRLVIGGLLAMSLSYALFGVLAWRFQTTNQPFVLDASMIDLPVASVALILATIAISLSWASPCPQSASSLKMLLQEHTPDRLRGARLFGAVHAQQPGGHSPHAGHCRWPIWSAFRRCCWASR